MNLIAGLHRFLLQVKEDFGETWPFLRQREHSVVNYLQADGSLHALAMRIRHSKMNACVIARLVDRRIGGGVDLELISRLHEDQAVIRAGTGVASKLVGVEVQRARHIRGCGERQFGCTVLDVEVARQDGLSVLNYIHVCRAPLLSGKNSKLNAVARLINAVLGAQQDLVLILPDLKLHRARSVVSLFVTGVNLE